MYEVIPSKLDPNGALTNPRLCIAVIAILVEHLLIAAEKPSEITQKDLDGICFKRLQEGTDDETGAFLLRVLPIQDA